MSTLEPDHDCFIPIMPWSCLRAPLPLSIALIEAPASVRVGAIYWTLVITDFLTKVRDGTARWSQRLLGRAMARSKSAFGIFKLARCCQCRSGWHVRTQDDSLRLA
jgi:hypothetical protein